MSADPWVKPSCMDIAVRRLEGFHPLGAAEQSALRGLADPRRHAAGSELAENGQGVRPAFISRGWAALQRILPDGRRQIIRLSLPGDMLGLPERRDAGSGSVVALTPLDAVDARPVLDMVRSGQASGLARALVLALRAEDQRLADHVVRVGVLTGYERMAHLFLELRDRLAEVGLGDAHRFPLPLTQEQLGATLGLSTVHVNRVLKVLRSDGMLDLSSGGVVLKRPEELARLAGRDEEPAAVGRGNA